MEFSVKSADFLLRDKTGRASRIKCEKAAWNKSKIGRRSSKVVAQIQISVTFPKAFVRFNTAKLL
jgi:hypothetical protein